MAVVKSAVLCCAIGVSVVVVATSTAAAAATAATVSTALCTKSWARLEAAYFKSLVFRAKRMSDRNAGARTKQIAVLKSVISMVTNNGNSPRLVAVAHVDSAVILCGCCCWRWWFTFFFLLTLEL